MAAHRQHLRPQRLLERLGNAGRHRRLQLGGALCQGLEALAGPFHDRAQLVSPVWCLLEGDEPHPGAIEDVGLHVAAL